MAFLGTCLHTMVWPETYMKNDDSLNLSDLF